MLTARQAGAVLEKQDSIVLDVVDVTGKHSLVTAPTLFGLPAKLNTKGASLTATAKRFEQAAAENPRADLSTIQEMDEIETRLENVNLWKTKWDPMVLEHSQLQWRRSTRGDLVLMLPIGEHVVILNDGLGNYVASGSVNGQKIQEGGYKDELDALQFAETTVLAYRPDLLEVLRRSCVWRNDPATAAQIRWLMKHRKVTRREAARYTKGQLADLIGSRWMRRGAGAE